MMKELKHLSYEKAGTARSRKRLVGEAHGKRILSVFINTCRESVKRTTLGSVHGAQCQDKRH